MGRSARVPFTVKAPKHDIPGRVSQAESFFVDSLEEWRQKMGLEKMTLIGHSLGAYFSVVYALKYPTRVNKLILLSPAGVPRNTDTSLPERELTDEADTNPGGDVQGATHAKIEAMRQEQKVQKRKEPVTTRVFKVRPTFGALRGTSSDQVNSIYGKKAGVLSKFYVRHYSGAPCSLARWVSCFSFIKRYHRDRLTPLKQYSSRRFSGLTEEETRDMHDYILNISLAKGSGEYCICTLQYKFPDPFL
jgi:cardiolipin-specific phospholipase